MRRSPLELCGREFTMKTKSFNQWVSSAHNNGGYILASGVKGCFDAFDELSHQPIGEWNGRSGYVIPNPPLMKESLRDYVQAERAYALLDVYEDRYMADLMNLN